MKEIRTKQGIIKGKSGNRQMTDPLSTKILRLRKEFDALLQDATEDEEKPVSPLPSFTRREIRALTRNEPDFTKQIVTPLDRTNRQTKRHHH